MSDEREYESLGDIMTDSTSKAIKGIVLFLSMLVYLAGIVYAEVHGLNLLTKGVNPEFLIWAYVGMVALGITAIALPVSLHYWFFAPMQKFVGLGFYLVDISLLFFNAVGDYAVNTGGAISTWLGMYLTFIVPATPIIVALGWAVIWLLDPASKERAAIETARVAMKMAKAQRMSSKARLPRYDEWIDAAADDTLSRVAGGTLGKRKKVTPTNNDPESIVSYNAEATGGTSKKRNGNPTLRQ